VNLASALLSNQIHVELLILAELHNENWVLLFALVIEVYYRSHSLVAIQSHDMTSGHFHLVLISAHDLQLEVNLALLAFEA
jgi:hypothetical protein